MSFTGHTGGFDNLSMSNPHPLAGQGQPTYCLQPSQSHTEHAPPSPADSSIQVFSAPQNGSVGLMGNLHHQLASNPAATPSGNANDGCMIEVPPTELKYA